MGVIYDRFLSGVPLFAFKVSHNMSDFVSIFCYTDFIEMETVVFKIIPRQFMSENMPMLSLFQLLDNKIVYIVNFFVQDGFVMSRRDSRHDNNFVLSFA